MIAEQAAPGSEAKLVSGWGRTAFARVDLARPLTTSDIQDWLRRVGPRGGLARGLGRAYGDAAQNAGGLLLDMTGLDRIEAPDLSQGVIAADAGVSLDQLMRTLLPHGLFVPVTPGTREVTLGGAIACDIHGKNHHRDGSLGRHIDWIDLVLPSGAIRRVKPGDAAFSATVGGMGLTGVVTAAKLRAIPVRTSSMRVTTERADNLDDLLSRMESGDERFQYSVAWVDCLARGRHLGRGVLTRGDHAEVTELSAKQQRDPLAFAPRSLLTSPPYVPSGLLNRPTMRALNAAWFQKAPTHDVSIQPIESFFHPLDGLRGWNRLYGPYGFLQHQSVVPFGAEATLRQIVERFSSAGGASFLTVLKRFGASSPLLSFPRPGWTLAVDVPASLPNLGALLDEVDDLVVHAGGRVYLAKDSRLRPELLEAMYPELPEWRRERDRLDPERVMASDLSRRLGLLGPRP